MAAERRLWGKLADEAGWQITEWSASKITVGDILSWDKIAAEEYAERKKK